MTEPLPMRVVEIPPFTDRERQIQEHYKLNLLRCRQQTYLSDFEEADIPALAMLLTLDQILGKKHIEVPAKDSDATKVAGFHYLKDVDTNSYAEQTVVQELAQLGCCSLEEIDYYRISDVGNGVVLCINSKEHNIPPGWRLGEISMLRGLMKRHGLTLMEMYF